MATLFLLRFATLDFYIGGGPQFASGGYRQIEYAVPADRYKRGMMLQLGASVGFKLF